MTSSRLADLTGPHRRPWSVGLARLAFSAVAVLATACGGGGSGGSGSATRWPTSVPRPPPRRPRRRAPALQRAPAPALQAAPPPRGWSAQPREDRCRPYEVLGLHAVAWRPQLPQPGHLQQQRLAADHARRQQGLATVPTRRKSCQKYAPQRPTAQNLTTAQQADYLKAAQCMRAHGINGFPDPDFSGGGVRFPLPQGMNANSTQFEAARHICQKLDPERPPLQCSTDENP